MEVTEFFSLSIYFDDTFVTQYLKMYMLFKIHSDLAWDEHMQQNVGRGTSYHQYCYPFNIPTTCTFSNILSHIHNNCLLGWLRQ